MEEATAENATDGVPNKSTIESSTSASTDSTEVSTEQSALAPSATKNVPSLSGRMQRLSVSPPRQRQATTMEGATVTTPTVAVTGRDSTPPPGAVQPPRGSSKPATPQNADSGVGLVRNRSSPSLLDASPKSATGGTTGGPPPRRRSPRETSPAVHRPAPTVRLQHELTPVTRNTNKAGQFVDHPDGHVVVSPEEKLHGEHLSLPSGDDYEAPPHSSLQHPLQQRRFSNNNSGAAGPPYLPVAARTRSVGGENVQTLAQTAREHLSQQGILGNSWDGNYNADEEDDGEDNVGEAVQFPKQKFYSFNSRQQYEAAVEQERGAFAAEPPLQNQLGERNSHRQTQWVAAGLKPYQPTRDDLADVGLNREETSRIFISRKTNNGSSEEESSRSSMNAVPLGERQWSIPSIRMANHVQGSTTSYTDEEDDLFRGYDDDASLSSRGSSLYLPEESASGVSEPLRLGPGVSTFHSSVSSEKHPHVVIEDGIDRVFHVDNVPDASAAAVASSPRDDDDRQAPPKEEPVNKPPERRKKRTKKHDDKERKAYEWLRTVELGPENNVFCEAASSKFLTGGVQQQAAAMVPTPLNRTDSSPATISSSRPNRP